jgi:hypothetical protein
MKLVVMLAKLKSMDETVAVLVVVTPMIEVKFMEVVMVMCWRQEIIGGNRW